MAEYLFVGGPADGRRLELTEVLPYIRIAHPFFNGRHETYLAQKFTDGISGVLSEHFIYFHDSVKSGFLQRLIDGYRPSSTVPGRTP